ncbi:Outer membrane protein assembly factor BamB, partial [termite gut metagenome]
MRRKIVRNIAIVSAIFIVTFSIMLITNYFQVKDVNPLQAEVIETLKQINDENANNIELQEQIRQLDLLARQAYFIRMDHLMAGVYILVAMLVVFIVSLHLYFSGEKDIPDKDIDPIDDWAVKTLARKYVNWVAGVLVVAALVFVVLTSPYLKMEKTDNQMEPLADAAQPELSEDNEYTMLPVEQEDSAVLTATAESNAEAETKKEEEEEIPKVTHNGFRGNNSNAISTAKSISTEWNLKTGANIVWANKILRQGFNSPVINGNKVFISGADEEARELYCYNLKTGELLWTVSANNIPGSP